MAPRYMALRGFPFGDERIEKGTLVPDIEGRDYRRLVELGFIREVDPQEGTGAPEGALVLVVGPGDVARFLSESGVLSAVRFVALTEAPAEAAEGLDVQPGAWVAVVDFGNDQGSLVRLDQVVPEELGAALARVLEARTTELRGALDRVGSLEGQVVVLTEARDQALAQVQQHQQQEAEAKAAAEQLRAGLGGAEDQPPPEGMKLVPEGAVVLPADALALLEAVPGINTKLAQKALAALTPPPEPAPAPETPPEA